MANVLETGMSYLQTQDPEVAACIENEFQRQKQNIELIASENIASPAVIAAMGSVLTNKYAEGYPGKRYYGGCDYVDVLETIAIERAKKLFGAAFVDCLRIGINILRTLTHRRDHFHHALLGAQCGSSGVGVDLLGILAAQQLNACRSEQHACCK